VELLEQALDKIEAEGWNNKFHKIKSLQQKLRNHDDMVAVSTDKTNSFRTASKFNCCKWLKGHLSKNDEKVSRSKLIELEEQALQTLHDKVELGVLSNKEEGYIKQTIDSKAIMPPKLLIEDHKNADSKGNFLSTRLTITATNFTSSFSEAGCLGINTILDDNDPSF